MFPISLTDAPVLLGICIWVMTCNAVLSSQLTKTPLLTVGIPDSEKQVLFDLKHNTSCALYLRGHPCFFVINFFLLFSSIFPGYRYDTRHMVPDKAFKCFASERTWTDILRLHP